MDINHLSFNIQAEASAATQSISRLIDKLNVLNTSFNTAATSGTGFANVLRNISNLSGNISGGLAGTAKQAKTTNTVMADATATTKKAASATKLADVETKKINNSLGVFQRQTKASSSGLSNLIKKITQITFLIYVARKAFSAFGQGVKSSIAYVENLNLFMVALGENTSKATAFIKEMSSSLYLDEAQLTRVQGLFYQISEALGLGSEKALTLSENFTKLAYDLASFYNITIEDAVIKLQAGLVGETEPLRRIGIIITENNLAETARNLGIKKSIRNMTEQEKIQLRYITALQQTKNAQGDLARTLQQPENLLRILREQFHVLMRELGNVAIPMLKKFLPQVIGLTIALSNLARAFAASFGYEAPVIRDDLGGYMKTVAKEVEDIEKKTNQTAKNLAKMLKYTRETMTSMTGIDELNILSPSGGVGVSAFDELFPEEDLEKATGLLDLALGNYNNRMNETLGIYDDIIEKWETLFGKIGATFKGAFDDTKAAFDDLWRTIFSEERQKVEDDEVFAGIRNFLDFMDNVLAKVLENITKVVSAFKTLWEDILKPMFEFVAPDWLTDLSSGKLETAVAGIVTALLGLKVLGKLLPGLTAATAGLKGLKIAGPLVALGGLAWFMIDPDMSIDIPAIVGKIKDKFIELTLALWDVLKEAFANLTWKDLFDAIKIGFFNIEDYFYDKLGIYPGWGYDLLFGNEKRKEAYLSNRAIREGTATTIEDTLASMGFSREPGKTLTKEMLDETTKEGPLFPENIYSPVLLNMLYGKEEYPLQLEDGTLVLQNKPEPLFSVVDKFSKSVDKFSNVIENLRDKDYSHVVFPEKKDKTPMFAKGGKPQKGSLFIAGEEGPELVGDLGDGTAVLNEDQVKALGIPLFANGVNVPKWTDTERRHAQFYTVNRPPVWTREERQRAAGTTKLLNAQDLTDDLNKIFNAVGNEMLKIFRTLIKKITPKGFSLEGILKETKNDISTVMNFFKEKGIMYWVGLKGTDAAQALIGTYYKLKDKFDEFKTELTEGTGTLNKTYRALSKLGVAAANVFSAFKDDRRIRQIFSSAPAEGGSTKEQQNIVGTMIGDMLGGTPLGVVFSLMQSVASDTGDVADSVMLQFVNNIPQFVQAGMDMILGLIEGVLEALPIILEQIPIVIGKVVEILTDKESLNTIISGLIEMVAMIVLAIPDIIFSLVEAIPDIIGTLISVFIENIPMFLKLGVAIGVAILEGIANLLIGGINTILKGINAIIPGKKWDIKLLGPADFSALMPKFATGGYPVTGQAFIAREAGAELIGNIGGRTAVMNNDQIVQAVSDGVYRAVSQALSEQEQREIVLNIDGRRLSRSLDQVDKNRGLAFGTGGY